MMGTIWIKEFVGGLDTRRMPETASGGILIKANNGHVTRGGEFEQRAAFVPTHELPAGTVGLFCTKAGLVVFGSAAAPVLPAGVSYQRLQNGGTTLTEVLSADLYQGKIYAVGQFSDGAVLHFYDGANVTDWYDGRARASFTVLETPSGATLSTLIIGGIAVISGAVTGPTTPETMATAIAAAISSYTSAPDYTATAVGNTVNIAAAVAGTAPNGLAVVPYLASGLVLDVVITGMAGGGTFGGTPATGSFRVAGGAGGSTIRPAINGVNLCPAVAWAGSVSATAAAVAASINATSTSPDYTATSNAGSVTVVTATNTDAVNGKDITFALTGTMSVLTGGAKATGEFKIVAANLGSSTLRVRVAGVDIMSAAVPMTGTLAASAASVVAAINSHSSTPDYTAQIISGTTIRVTAADKTAGINGAAITFVTTGSITVTQTSAMSGGVTPYTTMKAMSGGAVDDAYTPGNFVATIGSKVYSTSGSVLHFSGIAAPTQWTTDAVGAGFIDMASQSSGSEELIAVARYQNLAAVFAERTVQVWSVDPDPTLNKQLQVMSNTGTASPRSITQFGDTDLFYLAESGLRSLRARDASNAAATTDIGVPVDDTITAKLQVLTEDERRKVIGLIEPVNGRFWLIMKDQVFVFSFFSGAKVSAWSTYDTTYVDGFDTVAFDVTEAVVFDRRVYLRSGDMLFCYGGELAAATYDATVAEAWLPYLDAGQPARQKALTGVDLAMRGTWEVYGAMELSDVTVEDKIGTFTETTYDVGGAIPFQHQTTHISMRFRSQGTGPHKLGACVVHFEGNQDED